MSNNRPNFLPYLTLLQKNLTNDKFFIGNYLFLTNNFSLFTNLLFTNTRLLYDLQNCTTFTVKKNKSYFLKARNKFRNLFIFNKYLFKYKFKFFNFLKFNLFLSTNNHFNFKHKKILLFKTLFIFVFQNLIKKN